MTAAKHDRRAHAWRRRRLFGFVVVAFVLTNARSAEAAALHRAARADDRAAVERLARAGADLEEVDESGATPLLTAVLAERADVVAALVDAGADADRSSELDPDPLDLSEAVETPGDRVLVSPLVAAAIRGNAEIARALIEGGADLEFRIFDGSTPLLLAAGRGHREVVALLLDEGAEVNVSDRRGITPLRAAVDRGDAALAALLTTHGGQVVATDDEDQAYEMLDERVDYEGFLPEITTPFEGGSVAGVSAVRPLGLALDPRRGRLYWSEFESGRIRSAALDGTDIEDVVLPEGLEDVGADGPVGIAIDAEAQRLYWASDGGYPRSVASVDHDGENRSDIVVGEGVNRPRAVTVVHEAAAVSSDGRAIASAVGTTRVYWSESISGRIRCAQDDGSDVRELVTSGISSIADRADAQAMAPLGLAWDGAARRLYWTDAAGARIESLAIDEPGDSRATTVGASAGLLMPVGLVLDAGAGMLYWTDPAFASIFGARLDGTGVRRVLGPDDGLVAPHALALDSEAGKLYWTDRVLGTVSRASIDGDAIETLVRPVEPVKRSDETGPVASCARAIVEQGRAYTTSMVAAIGTCLVKVDMLQAVKRKESDAAAAVPACRESLARSGAAEARDDRDRDGVREQRRDVVRAACADVAQSPALRARLAAALDEATGGYEREALSKTCSGRRSAEQSDAGFHDPTGCVADAYAAIVRAVLLTRYPSANAWLDELEPFLGSRSVASDRHADAADLQIERRALAGLSAARTLLADVAPHFERTSRDVTTGVAASQASESARADGSLAEPSRAADGPFGFPASGQLRSYRARRAGSASPQPVDDDGALRAGRPLRYRDNADGTISDLVTGLMWEKKCDGCVGVHEFAAKYASVDPRAEATLDGWLTALNREGGTGFAGYDDWRIPTAAELTSIVDYERFNPAVTTAFDGALCGRGCADLSLPTCSCTAMSYYWSSTPFAAQTGRAIGVAFHLGLITEMPVSQAAHVRAVRGVAPPGLSRAASDCDGTAALRAAGGDPRLESETR